MNRTGPEFEPLEAELQEIKVMLILYYCINMCECGLNFCMRLNTKKYMADILH